MIGRIALLLFCLSAGCYATSGLLRIMHWPLGGLLRLIALGGFAAAAIVLVIAVVRNRGLKGLFNAEPGNDEGGR